MKIYGESCKSLKIFENPYKSMKIIKSSNHRILERSAAEAVAYKCAAARLSHAD
jgi:hypothetical protein